MKAALCSSGMGGCASRRGASGIARRHLPRAGGHDEAIGSRESRELTLQGGDDFIMALLGNRPCLVANSRLATTSVWPGETFGSRIAKPRSLTATHWSRGTRVKTDGIDSAEAHLPRAQAQGLPRPPPSTSEVKTRLDAEAKMRKAAQAEFLEWRRTNLEEAAAEPG